MAGMNARQLQKNAIEAIFTISLMRMDAARRSLKAAPRCRIISCNNSTEKALRCMLNTGILAALHAAAARHPAAPTQNTTILLATIRASARSAPPSPCGKSAATRRLRHTAAAARPLSFPRTAPPPPLAQGHAACSSFIAFQPAHALITPQNSLRLISRVALLQSMSERSYRAMFFRPPANIFPRAARHMMLRGTPAPSLLVRPACMKISGQPLAKFPPDIYTSQPAVFEQPPHFFSVRTGDTAPLYFMACMKRSAGFALIEIFSPSILKRPSKAQ